MISKSRFFTSAFTLTASALGMRWAGMMFNLYLSSHIGSAGLGRFSLVMSVYAFALTAAAAGIGLAVTRVISEEASVGGAACTSMKTGIRYSLCTGIGAAVLLALFSAPIAKWCLHDIASALALRILALSLPPAALSSALGGYFIARHKAEYGAAVNFISLLVRIGASVLFLYRYPDIPTAALAGGCLVSECVGFLVSWILYLCDRRRTTKAADMCIPKKTNNGEIPRIAIPIAVTACIRSGLGTVLHLLIPIGLARAGLGREAALSVYGTVHGMVLPVLLLPFALFSSAATLLVPEIAACRAKGNNAAIVRLQKRALGTSLFLCVLISGIFFCFGDTIGTYTCESAEAGRYLCLLAPLVPIMYIDTVVDAFLKGLDEQVASMRYNILDAAFSVLMAIVLLPQLGTVGYIVLLYASETFNLILSARKLHRVMPAHLSVIPTLAKALISFCGARAIARVARQIFADILHLSHAPLVLPTAELVLILLLFFFFAWVFSGNFCGAEKKLLHPLAFLGDLRYNIGKKTCR